MTDFLKKKTWADTCIFSMIPIVAKVSPEDTLSEIGQKLRNDMMNKY